MEEVIISKANLDKYRQAIVQLQRQVEEIKTQIDDCHDKLNRTRNSVTLRGNPPKSRSNNQDNLSLLYRRKGRWLWSF